VCQLFAEIISQYSETEFNTTPMTDLGIYRSYLDSPDLNVTQYPLDVPVFELWADSPTSDQQQKDAATVTGPLTIVAFQSVQKTTIRSVQADKVEYTFLRPVNWIIKKCLPRPV
jgi:hypothetical protein